MRNRQRIESAGDFAFCARGSARLRSGSMQASASCGATSRTRSLPGCRPATRLAAIRELRPAPIWMAALLATPCHAVTERVNRVIRWDCRSGRAIYTNRSAKVETIQPLGVRLRGGDTLAVFWRPGETGYTTEVYGQTGE